MLVCYFGLPFWSAILICHFGLLFWSAIVICHCNLSSLVKAQEHLRLHECAPLIDTSPLNGLLSRHGHVEF